MQLFRFGDPVDVRVSVLALVLGIIKGVDLLGEVLVQVPGSSLGVLALSQVRPQVRHHRRTLLIESKTL